MAISEAFNHLHPRFYSKAVENTRLSKEMGIPQFRDIEMCEIRVAGDTKTIHHHRANESYHLHRPNLGDPGTWLTPIDLFPEEYAAFKAGEEQIVAGTSIAEAPFLTEAGRATLKKLNVYTIEQLAGIGAPETLGMQGDDWVEKSNLFLKSRDGFSDLSAMQKRIRDLEMQVAANGKAGVTGTSAEKSATAADKDAPETVTEPGPFLGMERSDLRNYIKDQTGESPRGNPSFKTLLGMAQEAADKLTAE